MCTDLPGGLDKLHRRQTAKSGIGDKGKVDCGQIEKVTKCHNFILSVAKEILRDFQTIVSHSFSMYQSI
jgi:hypothetical protein